MTTAEPTQAGSPRFTKTSARLTRHLEKRWGCAGFRETPPELIREAEHQVGLPHWRAGVCRRLERVVSLVGPGWTWKQLDPDFPVEVIGADRKIEGIHPGILGPEDRSRLLWFCYAAHVAAPILRIRSGSLSGPFGRALAEIAAAWWLNPSGRRFDGERRIADCVVVDVPAIMSEDWMCRYRPMVLQAVRRKGPRMIFLDQKDRELPLLRSLPFADVAITSTVAFAGAGLDLPSVDISTARGFIDSVLAAELGFYQKDHRVYLPAWTDQRPATAFVVADRIVNHASVRRADGRRLRKLPSSFASMLLASDDFIGALPRMRMETEVSL